jgi:acyl dehydratase
MDELYLEDMTAGRAFDTPSCAVSAEDVAAFAADFDPQPFHLDPEAAARTPFGGIVASGWHTAALTMRLLVDHGPRVAGGLVGLGVDELSWRPVRPGDELRVECDVLTARPTSAGDRGIVRLRVRTLNQRDEEVQHMLATLLVPARMPLGPGLRR